MSVFVNVKTFTRYTGEQYLIFLTHSKGLTSYDFGDPHIYSCSLHLIYLEYVETHFQKTTRKEKY